MKKLLLTLTMCGAALVGAAQQIITATVTVTNTTGTTNGETFVINGGTRTFTNLLIWPQETILAGTNIQFASSNLFINLAAAPVSGVTATWNGSNAVTVQSLPNFALTISQGGNWGTVNWFTDSIVPLTAVRLPISGVGAYERTNVESWMVQLLNDTAMTNAVSSNAPAFTNILKWMENWVNSQGFAYGNPTSGVTSGTVSNIVLTYGGTLYVTNTETGLTLGGTFSGNGAALTNNGAAIATISANSLVSSNQAAAIAALSGGGGDSIYSQFSTNATVATNGPDGTPLVTSANTNSFVRTNMVPLIVTNTETGLTLGGTFSGNGAALTNNGAAISTISANSLVSSNQAAAIATLEQSGATNFVPITNGTAIGLTANGSRFLGTSNLTVYGTSFLNSSNLNIIGLSVPTNGANVGLYQFGMIPYMTTNTLPSGSSAASSATTNSYLCFQTNFSTPWSSDGTSFTNIVSYTFQAPIMANSMQANWLVFSSDTVSNVFQGSQDGITWVNLSTNFSASGNLPHFTSVFGQYFGQYFRWYVVLTGSPTLESQTPAQVPNNGPALQIYGSGISLYNLIYQNIISNKESYLSIISPNGIVLGGGLPLPGSQLTVNGATTLGNLSAQAGSFSGINASNYFLNGTLLNFNSSLFTNTTVQSIWVTNSGPFYTFVGVVVSNGIPLFSGSQGTNFFGLYSNDVADGYWTNCASGWELIPKGYTNCSPLAQGLTLNGWTFAPNIANLLATNGVWGFTTNFQSLYQNGSGSMFGTFYGTAFFGLQVYTAYGQGTYDIFSGGNLIVTPYGTTSASSGFIPPNEIATNGSSTGYVLTSSGGQTTWAPGTGGGSALYTQFSTNANTATNSPAGLPLADQAYATNAAKADSQTVSNAVENQIINAITNSYPGAMTNSGPGIHAGNFYGNFDNSGGFNQGNQSSSLFGKGAVFPAGGYSFGEGGEPQPFVSFPQGGFGVFTENFGDGGWPTMPLYAAMDNGNYDIWLIAYDYELPTMDCYIHLYDNPGTGVFLVVSNADLAGCYGDASKLTNGTPLSGLTPTSLVSSNDVPAIIAGTPVNAATLQGANTNQLLFAGAGGSRDASGITNVPPATSLAAPYYLANPSISTTNWTSTNSAGTFSQVVSAYGVIPTIAYQTNGVVLTNVVGLFAPNGDVVANAIFGIGSGLTDLPAQWAFNLLDYGFIPNNSGAAEVNDVAWTNLYDLATNLAGMNVYAPGYGAGGGTFYFNHPLNIPLNQWGGSPRTSMRIFGDGSPTAPLSIFQINPPNGSLGDIISTNIGGLEIDHMSIVGGNENVPNVFDSATIPFFYKNLFYDNGGTNIVLGNITQLFTGYGGEIVENTEKASSGPDACFVLAGTQVNTILFQQNTLNSLAGYTAFLFNGPYDDDNKVIGNDCEMGNNTIGYLTNFCVITNQSDFNTVKYNNLDDAGPGTQEGIINGGDCAYNHYENNRLPGASSTYPTVLDLTGGANTIMESETNVIGPSGVRGSFYGYHYGAFAGNGASITNVSGTNIVVPSPLLPAQTQAVQLWPGVTVRTVIETNASFTITDFVPMGGLSSVQLDIPNTNLTTLTVTISAPFSPYPVATNSLVIPSGQTGYIYADFDGVSTNMGAGL